MPQPHSPSPANPPFAVQRIDHLVLRIRDETASLRFYVEALGCTVERRRDDLGLIHLRAGASLIDLITLHGPLGRRGGEGAGESGRNVDHVCLRIEPFDEEALLRHLARFGVVPQGPATVNFGAEGDGPSMYVSDPDGNVVELKGAAKE